MSYTPTTEEVRRLYVRHCSLRGRTKYPPLEELEDEFDRWLTALIREAKAEAWDAGHGAFEQAWESDHLYPYDYVADNPYREGSET